MSGYDSPFHLAEECSNANVASPRAIFLTSAMGGTFGWFLQLVVAYTVVDITAVLESDLGQPFAAYLNDILPQKIVIAVLSLTIIAGFAMGQGCMIAASRVTFVSAPPPTHPRIPPSLPPLPGLRPRRRLPPLPHLVARQHLHAHARQRRLAQQPGRHSVPAAHLRRRAGDRGDLQHRRVRRLRRLHDPDRHPRLLRRQPVPARALEPGPREHSDRRRGQRVRDAHGADSVLAERDGAESGPGEYELDGAVLWGADAGGGGLVGG